MVKVKIFRIGGQGGQRTTLPESSDAVLGLHQPSLLRVRLGEAQLKLKKGAEEMDDAPDMLALSEMCRGRNGCHGLLTAVVFICASGAEHTWDQNVNNEWHFRDDVAVT